LNCPNPSVNPEDPDLAVAAGRETGCVKAGTAMDQGLVVTTQTSRSPPLPANRNDISQ